MSTGEGHEQHTGREAGLSRRQFLRRVGLAGAGLAALPILAACGTSLPTPTATRPAAAASAAPASAAPASAAPAAGASAAGSARPSTAASGAPAAGASAAPASAAPAPPTPTVIAGIPRAKSNARVTGKYQFIQTQDFHPDHNAFLRAEIQEYCKQQGWELEITYAAGFQGGGDLLTATIAAVQAGNPYDTTFHDAYGRNWHAQGVLDPVTDLAKEMSAKYGAIYPLTEAALFFENEWWGVPFYGRTGGMWARKDIFAKYGLDVNKDTSVSYDQLRETALKISDPDNKVWGWGMTVNRSGDGNSMVQNVLLRFGSQLQDQAGQIITFDSPQTVAGLNWLKETYTDPKWAKALPPGILSWTDTSNNEAFLAGTLAITDNAGTMYAKAVFDKVPFAKEIVNITRPVRNTDKKQLDSINVSRFHAIKNSKNKAATYDIIRHLLSEPVQKQLYVTSPGYVVPPYKNAWADPLIQNDANAKFNEALAYPTDVFTGLRSPGPSSAAVDSIGTGNYFTDMAGEVLQGKKAEDVAKDYANRFVQIFKDFGLKGR